MKLVFAAPESGLPSLLTAFDSHASSLHFLMKLVLAAPVRGLPSLLTALVAQDCAIAVPTEKEVIRRATKIRFIITSVCCSAFERIQQAPWKKNCRTPRCGVPRATKLRNCRRVPLSRQDNFLGTAGSP